MTRQPEAQPAPPSTIPPSDPLDHERAPESEPPISEREP